MSAIPGTAAESTHEASARRWLAAVLVVLAAALATRIHDLSAYPPLHDFDGPGHSVNVLALERGELPDPTSWGGFHPPLYYAIGAAVWRALPESVPVHVGLRAISMLAGIALAIVLWRALRRFAAEPDAAIAATLAFCSPVFTISGAMLGNEMLGACLVTVAVARLTAIPAGSPVLRHALVTGLWLGAALLTKSSALVAVGVAGLAYLIAARAEPRRALAAAGLAGALPLATATPHYARLLHASGGSLMSVVSGAAMAAQVQDEMRAQPPGERHVSDYVSLPLATFFAPHHAAPGLVRSVPGLLYASAFADGHGEFLPGEVPHVLAAESLLALGGIVPTLLAAAGLVRVLRAPHRFARALGPLLLGALMVAALVRYTWVLPAYSAVKASYLLPAALPAALLVACGLSGLSPRWRGPARGFCLALGLMASAVLWQGWWA